MLSGELELEKLTFALFKFRDTLHRHTRLHSRTEEEGPAGKGPKKRRASTSTSAKPSTSNVPKSPKPSSSSSSGSSSAKPITKTTTNNVNPKQDEAFTSSSAAFGLSMSLPVHPPSFPAYSQPETFLAHNSTTSSHHADFPSIGNSNSIDPSVLPLYSRVGDVATNSNYGNRIPTRRASHGGGPTQVLVSSAIGGGGNGGSATLATGGGGGGMSRPRALTLAGLPESFGCFSLINSPASSTASLSLDEEDDDDDDEYRDSSMEEDTIAEEKQDPTWTVDSPSFPPAPESHYPSPAFTSYSPSALHNDSLTDLQAILDNDPVPSNSFGKSQSSRRRRASHQVASGTQLAAVPEPDFDFEAFAASIEGAAPSNGLAPGGGPHHRSLSYDEILMQKNGGGGNLFDRYPTPPTDTIPALPLPTSTDNEFEWLHQYTASAEAQQQAREDAAATAAMFSRGFGLDPSQTQTSPSSSSSSALGLNLGLPSPPLTAMAVHAHTVATSTSSSPHFSLPISTSSAPPAQGVFSNLAQTYASTYPTFSLSAPHASIVPTPLQSALASHSSISIATTEPGTDTSTTSPSLHDLLAAAWERRQRHPSQTCSSSSPILPASINLKSPFTSSSSSQVQAKQTPAFYIPSAMHSSAAQIGTATNVDSQAMTVSASGPLSLPIPTWAN